MPGLEIRPTADRLRETLFDVLTAGNPAALAETTWFDLYAGTGAVGIEALSRGAKRVKCVERAPAARVALWTNLRRLGVTDAVRVRAGSVAEYLKRASGPWDAVFLDPPYDAAVEYAATLGLLGGAAAGLLAEGAVVIAEHRRKEKLEENYGELKRTRLLEQGDAALSFYAISSKAIAE